MGRALCVRYSGLQTGTGTWVCGIVYILGQINFVGDPSLPPHLSTADLCVLVAAGWEETSPAPVSLMAGRRVSAGDNSYVVTKLVMVVATGV